eukprot:CAMPEP_0174293156 /NCGR_PEP_ID=MMETSP0809-20121228/37682_1 /TAXON_ID=73025 ORGANISM="Eutreptiella gymnastica-like, Strain CCMP1594" /NCGR_SAMPLE_ID=MMETSP0809 /ASSEMBLY_ACC=CAM_ASM_000658 /LENGTH=49 /DNA_ID= /DNA_START= /DNA_END= /DNA_ORIENTATION=
MGLGFGGQQLGPHENGAEGHTLRWLWHDTPDPKKMVQNPAQKTLDVLVW